MLMTLRDPSILLVLYNSIHGTLNRRCRKERYFYACIATWLAHRFIERHVVADVLPRSGVLQAV